MTDTSNPSATEQQPLTEAEIDKKMAFIDGVNGAGGHHISDPYARALLRRQIAGEITGDECRALMTEYRNEQCSEE